MIGKGGNPKPRGLANMVNGAKYPNQSPTIFVDLSRTHEGGHCPDERRRLPDSISCTFLYIIHFSFPITNCLKISVSSLRL